MSTTEKFMGKNMLVKRLSTQVGSEELAKKILISRGHMDASGHLTPEGTRRDNMTAEERAKDRMSKKTGAPAKDLSYNPATNQARFKPLGRR